MAEIAVIGCGQAGLVVATSFASLGHRVVGIDIDRWKIEACRNGVTPIHEPGLDGLLTAGLASARLTFLHEYPERIEAESVFIAVDTPTSPSGACDLKALKPATASMAPVLRDGAIVVNKGTVPVGTGMKCTVFSTSTARATSPSCPTTMRRPPLGSRPCIASPIHRSYSATFASPR